MSTGTSTSGVKGNYAVCSRLEAFYTGGRVHFSTDGQYMFCCSGNHVTIVCLGDGKMVQIIGKDEDPEITSFTVSPDDLYLIVANRQLLLTQYNWKDNTVLRKWRAIHTGPVGCMSFDRTSTLLASGGGDTTVKVWDIVKQYCTHNLRGHTGVITNVLFHHDTELLQLFTSADDYQIRQWDLRQSECLHVYSGHYSAISSLTVTTDGATLVSGGRDSVVLCWDLVQKSKKTIPVYENIESVLALETGASYPQFNVLPSSRDLHVITAGSKGILRVWNTRTGVCVFAQSSLQDGSDVVTGTAAAGGDTVSQDSHICQATFVPSLAALAVVTYQHNIILYTMSELCIYKQFAGYNDDILDVKLFGVGDETDDRRLLVATNSDQIKVFDTDTWHCNILTGHSDIVMAVDVYHKTGQYAVSASKDKSIRIWRIDAADGSIRCIAVGSGHSKAVNTIAMSRSRPGFCVSAGEDHTLKLWQLADAVGKEGVACITSHLTERAHDKDINSVAVSPNDKLIVTGSQDKTAKLWRSGDLGLVGVFRGHKRSIWCVAFSPVDQAVATASADCLIKIWSITDFTCVKTFEGHESSVLKIVFVARGMQIVSCGSDGLVKLWTIKTNECIKTFDEHTEKIWALCASRADDRLVTGGADSNILIWKDVTEEEVVAERTKQENLLVKEQKLMNLLQHKKYVKAIGLAITLEQPFRLLKILQMVLATENGLEEFEATIAKLRPDQIGVVLRFAAEWNTNSKFSYESQTVFNIVLKSHSLDELLKLPNIRATVETFLPYTERHFQRLCRLQQQAAVLDYTLHCMKLVSSDNTSDELVTMMDELDETDFLAERLGALGEMSVVTPAVNQGQGQGHSDSDSDDAFEDALEELTPDESSQNENKKRSTSSQRKRIKVG